MVIPHVFTFYMFSIVANPFYKVLNQTKSNYYVKHHSLIRNLVNKFGCINVLRRQRKTFKWI